MDRSHIIATLKRHERELHRQGVVHAALFGSAARGQIGPDSDIDIVIDVDPATSMNAYDYVGLKQYIAGLFEQPVDVVNRQGLKSHIAPIVLADAVYAF